MGRAAHGLALLALAAAPAFADGKPRRDAAGEPFDVGPARASLVVLGDGKGHFVALVPFAVADELLFFGDGRTMWAQRPVSAGRDGTKSFFRAFWEPRVAAPARALVELAGGRYTLVCDDRVTELQPVGAPPAEMRFMKPRWRHEALALLRDGGGAFLYLDRLRDAPATVRLFRGAKGRLRPIAVTRVATDGDVEVVATASGELRLAAGRGEAHWLQGARKSKLEVLPVEDNLALIYRELGVYAGEPLGTPCDEL